MSEKDGVVAIIPAGQEGFHPRVYGMGILLSDREVVTCAHVVQRVLGLSTREKPSEAVVHLCFPYADSSLSVSADLDLVRYFPPGPEQGKLQDIAILKLRKDAPNSAGRAVLRSDASGGSVKIYGFRGKELSGGDFVSHPEGEIAEARVVGPLPGGRKQAVGAHTIGANVERGFSGAGVYDTNQDAVVGMVVKADVSPERRIFQFIEVAYLNEALGRHGVAHTEREKPQAIVSSPRELRRKALQDRYEQLKAEYEAIERQRRNALEGAQEVRLAAQAEQKLKELEQVHDELSRL